MPSIERVKQSYRSEDLEVVMINVREPRKEVESFIHSNRYTFNVLLDAHGEASSDYSVYGLPAVVLIDRQGNILFKAVGYMNWDSEKMRSILDSALKV